ncbi:hypothetical protein SeLEV6574_g07933 [Synchytrium endobioticum]|nr:hypothetical protein SeLEV6574_g07933 [Synchytrium endobioticum]
MSQAPNGRDDGMDPFSQHPHPHASNPLLLSSPSPRASTSQPSHLGHPRPLSEATAAGHFTKSNTSSQSSLHRTRSLDSTNQPQTLATPLPIPITDNALDVARHPCCNLDRAFRNLPFSAFCPTIFTSPDKVASAAHHNIPLEPTEPQPRVSFSSTMRPNAQQWSAASLHAAAKRPPSSLLKSSIGIPPTPAPIIQITDAQKISEFGSSYISYTIQTDVTDPYIFHLESRHRYSDFEGLRKLLQKVHPTIVVPPIPEKHSVAAYAAKPGKAKDDPNVIEKRKRLLQSFLNRVAAHPILGREHVFHQFLQPNISWIENLASSGLAHHLRKKEPKASLITDKPTLKRPDPLYVASEDFTSKFASHISHLLKVHKKIVKHHQEIASTYTELGSTYNGWSLSETLLSEAIEKVGQAIDSTVLATHSLSSTLEERFSEPLQEYSQFSRIIEKVLLIRHKRQAAYENLTESLQNKHLNLAHLEKSELEAQRLAAVISAEGGSNAASGALIRTRKSEEFTGVTVSRGLDSNSNSTSTSSSTVRHSNGPRVPGLMAAINSIMDNDPELTRRNNISKTKDRITSLEDQAAVALRVLRDANDTVQKDLDLFQERKITDLRNMLLAYALAQREYQRRGAAVWEEAKGVIQNTFDTM